MYDSPTEGVFLYEPLRGVRITHTAISVIVSD